MDALPSIFLERLNRIIPPEKISTVLETFHRYKALSIRMNTLKSNSREVRDCLLRKDIRLIEVPWYDHGFLVEGVEPQELSRLDEVNEGKVYIQSLSSMLPVVVLDPKPGETILDLCAAPGSKTTQMAAHMNNQGKIVAVEAVRGRFYRLKSVIQLLGAQIIEPKCLDGRRYRLSGDALGVIPVPAFCRSRARPGTSGRRARESGNPHAGINSSGNPKVGPRFRGGDKINNGFDKILVDAPCSSEGRFKSFDKESVGYWSLRKIKEMVQKQRGLLWNACRMLKPGGVLVYSTCTFAPEENEGVVDWVLRKMDGEVAVEPIDLSHVECYPAIVEWGGRIFNQQVRHCCRVLPTSSMEGFFMAKLVRR